MQDFVLFLMGNPSATGGEQATGSPYSSLIFFAVIILIFYFFMIRPQVKRQKEMKNYRSSLQKGDKVVTAGGIYGKLVEVKETTVLIEVDQDVRLKVDKNSILKSAADIENQPKN